MELGIPIAIAGVLWAAFLWTMARPRIRGER